MASHSLHASSLGFSALRKFQPTRPSKGTASRRGEYLKLLIYTSLFIPPEITDRIIAAAAGIHRQTLLSCSLVCHNWVPASRFHLFNWVSIGPTKYDVFVDMVLHSESMHLWLAHVYVFSLDDGDAGGAAGDSQEERNDSPTPSREVGGPRTGTQRFVHDFAGHLPNLLELWLSHADWTRHSPHPSAYILFGCFTSVRRLVLEHCHFPSFAGVRRMLTALPRLDDLRLSNVEWPHTECAAAVPAHPARPSLVVLMMHASSPKGCTTCLLAWLASTPTKGSMREVEFYDDAWTEWHFEFLRAVAGALTSLEEPTLLDLQSLLVCDFPALRKLGLLLQAGDSDEWHDLASVLRQLRARHLQHIILYNVPARSSVPAAARMDDGRQEEDVYKGLELLDPVFDFEDGDLNLKALETVEFVVYRDRRDSASERQLLSAIESKLPKFKTRGKLVVRCQCDSVPSSDDVSVS
ncbi:hypothetical protein C8Q80DRAFT_120998 [Daedaleopsis nitida]|nr:hypothetical protein C8Q80DRAFT_120998 [Daedaleopsis nitida]